MNFGTPRSFALLGKGHGGLYKAAIKEERRKRTAKRRERSDQSINCLLSRALVFFLNFLVPKRLRSRIATDFPHSPGTIKLNVGLEALINRTVINCPTPTWFFSHCKFDDQSRYIRST